MGDDLDDAPVADLEAVAEGSVDDVATPVLRHAVDVRQLVHQTGRGEDPTGDDGVATDELDAEAIIIGSGHTTGTTDEDLTAVAADLLTTSGDQRRWRKPLATEVAVQVGGGRVARFAGIDDDRGSALASQLEGGGQAGGRPADDGDIAVPFDETGGVIAHDPTLR